VIVPKAPKLNVEEQATLSLSSRFTDKDWTRIPNTVRDSVGYFRKIEDDSAAWGKAVTMCDASAARVMAYVWNQSTRRETAKESWAGRKSYGLGAQRLLTMSVEIPGSHSCIRVAGVRMPPGVDDRIFSAWWVWSLQENGTFVCALAPYSGLGDCDATRRVDEAIACHQASKGNIHGVIRAFMKIKPLSTNVCRLEYVGQGNAGGVIPKMAMNMSVKSILGLAAQVRPRPSEASDKKSCGSGAPTISSLTLASLPPPPTPPQTLLAADGVDLHAASRRRGSRALRRRPFAPRLSRALARPAGGHRELPETAP
jgi:hypothetical protein